MIKELEIHEFIINHHEVNVRVSVTGRDIQHRWCAI